MTKEQEVVIYLVRVGLNFDDSLDELRIELRYLSEKEWENILKIANEQGVTAICYDAFNRLEITTEVPQNIKLQFISSDLLYTKEYIKKRTATSRLLQVLGENQIPMLILKGMSLNRYYPVPQHRYSGDIDIYLGNNYERGNELLLEKGGKLVGTFYRHSEIKFENEIVENHSWLSSKGEGENKRLEPLLKKYADESLKAGKQGEEIFPNANLNALFLSWHSAAHFLFEGITLRHITDWAMYLKNESRYVDEEMFKRAKEDFSFGNFTDIITFIALRYLKTPSENVPNYMLDGVESLEPELCEKVLNYLFLDKGINHWQNKWKVRFDIVKKMFESRWKYKEVFGINLLGMLYRKTKFVLFEKE